MRIKKLFNLFPILILVFFVASCAGDDKEVEEGELEIYKEEKTHEVRIENNSYNPKEIEVNEGDEVRWINNDSTEHTVVSGVKENYLFASGEIRPGEDFEFTFQSIGPVEYYCEYHPEEMRGIVLVK